MITVSVSKKLTSPKNAYKNEKNLYTFGKSTTFNYVKEQYNNLEAVLPVLLLYAVSPYLYKEGRRDANTVIGVGNLVMLDIDANYNIENEVIQATKGFNFQFAVLPTQNHLTDLNGQKAYKYRLVIPVLGITTVTQYKAFIHWFIRAYQVPHVDSASWSDARFYAPTLPLAGTTFSCETLASNQMIPYKITEDIIKQRAFDLEMLTPEGNIELNPAIYPRDTTSGWLQFSEDMLQYLPVEDNVESTHDIAGNEFTTLYEGSENTIDSYIFKALTEHPTVAFGDVASSLTNSSRVFCKCPTAHLHTNPEDTRYAWLLKTGSGEARLYCASDHCKQEFGEFRTIRLPKWDTFIADPNYYRTITRLNQLYERVESNILTTLTILICNWKSVKLEKWHEKKAYAKDVMYSELIDENALKVMCLMISKERGLASYIYDISLSGCALGKLNIKTAKLLMQGGWFTYLFRAGYSQFLSDVGSEDVSKPKIFNIITNTVDTDVQFSEIVREVDRLKPSEQLNGRIQIDYSSIGREIYRTNNSFDTPVMRRMNYLEKNGVYKDKDYYTEVVEAFTRHWTLPYGSVTFEGMQISDLPTLLILYNTLNMYTDGVVNQRHSAIVITAPSGIGKTSLIKNFAEAGLSNDDSHGANIFGHDGLYPKSVDDVKNKLWVTGDELSPKMMKDINMSALLANLTRLEVNVNVKGKIDSKFTAFGKVLWGARAWDAISSGSQATELRNRLIAITYQEEHFNDKTFMNLCEVDTGRIDNIIQHRLIRVYQYIKSLVLDIDEGERVAVLNRFKSAVKQKYSGILSYEVEVDLETNAITSVSVEKVASDKDRDTARFLELLLQYRAGLITNPTTGRNGGAVMYSTTLTGDGSELDSLSRRILASEELTYKLSKIKSVPPCIVLPNVRTYKDPIYFKILGKHISNERTIWGILHGVNRTTVNKLLRSYAPNSELGMLSIALKNTKQRKLQLWEGTKINTNTRDYSFIVIAVSDIEKLLEKISR